MVTYAAITVDTDAVMKESQRHLLKDPQPFEPLPVPSLDKLNELLQQQRVMLQQIFENDKNAVERGNNLLFINA